MFFDYLLSATVALNLTLGIVVLARNPKSASNRYFGVFSLFLAIWIISNFLENEPGIVGPDLLPIFLRLDFGFGILFFAAWFHFCISFIYDRLFPQASRIWITLISFILTGTFAFFSFISSLVTANIHFDQVIIFDPGVLSYPYFILVLLYSGLGLAVLRWGRKRFIAQGKVIEAQQLNIIFWGYLFSFGISSAINILQPFYPISLTVSRLALYNISVISIFSAYAVAKKGFLDVRLVAARITGYFIILTVITLLFAFFGIFLIEKTFSISITSETFAVYVALTSAIAITVQPLEQFVGKITKRIFFQNFYDKDILLGRLTKIMATTIDIESMADQIVTILAKEMEIEKAALIVIEKHKFVGVKQTGYPDIQKKVEELESLFHKGYGADRFCVFEDLPESPLKTLFRELDIAITIPITVKNEEEGMLVLGPKSSGGVYYQGDIEFLRIFASEAGIAIQNAKAYEAIRKFNEELEKTVEERTRELKETQARELAKAQDVARLKDEFVFIAAHELRTPVAAIKGLAELIQDSKGRLSKELKHYVDSIYRSSDNLNQLITDLLEIARSDAGAMKIETTSVELVPIIEDVVKEVAPLAAKSKVKISFTPDKMAPTVSADAEKIREVITNLVGNAIKYNRPKGRVDIVTRIERNNFITEVRDTGFGIPQTQQEKIFQKFFRAQTPGTEKVPGTGLGLFLTRMLIERMGGTITFQSTEGVGSSFTFSLPLETSFMPEQIPQKAA